MDESVVATRRKRLWEWIQKHHDGVQASFVNQTDINQGELSALLKSKSFGEKKARALERAAKMPPMYLDGSTGAESRGDGEFTPFTEEQYVYIPVFNVSGSLGAGSIADEHDGVIGKHSYSQTWLITQGLDPSSLSRIKGNGRSMEPTIFDGDTLLVNHAERRIIDGKVFVFRIGDELRVKRLFRLMDGRVRVVSDNPDKSLYPDEFLTPAHMPEIIGRIRDRSGTSNL